MGKDFSLPLVRIGIMKFCNLLDSEAPEKFKIPKWLKKQEIQTLIEGNEEESEDDQDSGVSGFSLLDNNRL